MECRRQQATKKKKCSRGNSSSPPLERKELDNYQSLSSLLQRRYGDPANCPPLNQTPVPGAIKKNFANNATSTSTPFSKPIPPLNGLPIVELGYLSAGTKLRGVLYVGLSICIRFL
jgi:hypothetical protein